MSLTILARRPLMLKSSASGPKTFRGVGGIISNSDDNAMKVLRMLLYLPFLAVQRC